MSSSKRKIDDDGMSTARRTGPSPAGAMTASSSTALSAAGGSSRQASTPLGPTNAHNLPNGQAQKNRGAETQSKSTSGRQRRSGENYKPYLKELARTAAYLEIPNDEEEQERKDLETDLKRWALHAWHHDGFCPSCDQALSALCGLLVRDDGVRSPWNGCIDRIKPGSKGGSFWPKHNRALICWACNGLKGSLTREEGRAMALRLMADGPENARLIDCRIQLRPSARRPRAPATEAFARELKDWVAKEHTRLRGQAEDSGKAFMVTVDELRIMILRQVVGKGDLVQLHCGVSVGLKHICFRRIDGKGDFVGGNLQPTLYGLHYCVNDAGDETLFWRWMMGLGLH
ncbi:hypothetical protein BDZ90DRAFT_227278 [Jaminaea rosea]|uniref:Uncharacterized protein n=1 Tax=Jaminaea rosea TaxID=1569628 RepID=A0A316UQH4_9BASI|nr:hypothetical protein BDZ90DRAFT_227278 [Jaminaea rosea]PWN27562.1 hypothetical protein BDZ90DRAFT_227278 [Jaminaea rosea]